MHFKKNNMLQTQLTYSIQRWDTTGKKYDLKVIREALKSKGISKEELKKTCANCPDKTCLRNFELGKEWHPCPAVLPFVEQDHV